MSDLLQYKGYYGSIHLNQEELVFHGKLEFIRSLVTYEGRTAKQLKASFEEAVDDYLITCKQRNILPEVPFKGSLNVRIGRELHRRIAVAAVHSDTSINSYIKNLLEKGILADNNMSAF